MRGRGAALNRTANDDINLVEKCHTAPAAATWVVDAVCGRSRHIDTVSQKGRVICARVLARPLIAEFVNVIRRQQRAE